jgi:hypothetical protein
VKGETCIYVYKTKQLVLLLNSCVCLPLCISLCYETSGIPHQTHIYFMFFFSCALCFPLIVCCFQYFCFFFLFRWLLFSEFGIRTCFSACVKSRLCFMLPGFTEFQRVRTLCERIYKALRCHFKSGLRCFDVRGQVKGRGSFPTVSKFGILSTHVNVYVGRLYSFT